MSKSVASEAAACMSVEDVVAAVNGNVKHGLSAIEAGQRLREHGANEFATSEPDPLWQKYLEQFKEPLILLLIGSAVVSLIMQQYDDAFSIFLAIMIVVTVAFVQEYKSEQALEALTKLVPQKCWLIRDNTKQGALAADVVVGDLVTFGVGDRIPADCRLIEAVNLEIDESNLTGENKTRSKRCHHPSTPLPSQSILHLLLIRLRTLAILRDNMAFMGTLVRQGHGKGIVTATAGATEFGIIFQMLDDVEERKTPLQEQMGVLGQQLSFLSFGIIGVIMIIGVLQGKPLVKMFTIAVSLAVAAIPEGLPIVVTVTLALGVMRMAKQNAIVKKLPAVEALGSATVVCSDKTGTLTENKMVGRYALSIFDQLQAEMTGSGYLINSGTIQVVDSSGSPVPNGQSNSMTHLLLAGMVCNNAQVDRGHLIGQPTEGALLVAAYKAGLQSRAANFERLEEIPFSSDTKWMAVRGALDVLLTKCRHVSSGHQVRHLSELDVQILNQRADQYAAQGFRVIALASGASLDELAILGIVAIADQARAGVREAVALLQQSRVKVMMITGDMKATAEAIAQSLGFYNPGLEAMDQLDLEGIIEDVRVFYRTSPKHKLKIVQALQHNGHIVAMTGDGVNDAPALKLAEIGVAMGETGTDVAKEAADMILVDDNFSTIMHAIEEGKGIAYNVRNFLRFQLSTSVAALTLISITTMLGMHSPLNAMQILWINILMDGPPAQSLGVEPVQRDVMTMPPRRAREPMLTAKLLRNVIMSAAIIVTGVLYVYFRELQDDVVTKRDTTMTFTCFVLFDMFNALTCRSTNKSIREIGLFSNSVFLYAVGGSLLGQLAVIYLPPLQAIFQTEALGFGDMVFLVMLCSTVWLADEGRKYWEQQRERRRHKRKSSDASA
ncbi:uncharacterized protein MONBRDRAFT_32456 [Monosiga brevicollis MX1]|uniref:Calcium-transporting ATPase n=1 Tax=Monosiga brevicollis TaxID=81824 RepID=A9UZL6_MONBE|nr:uncharacterized protein MONBRDRAFT_32456 [Monosiga brevicollis MX1]EDQ89391.1 predicted protein [Monosiga brevicollis MX1]|eukprot:XP_001745967.1 hypothetical protein [Monosiga brevicollis MX1]